MKAFSSGRGLAQWFIRISLAGIILFRSVPEILDFNIDTITFYLSLLQGIMAILLFIGGFTKKASATVIAGLVLSIVLLISLFEGWPGKINESVFLGFLLFSVAFYYFTHGDKS